MAKKKEIKKDIEKEEIKETKKEKLDFKNIKTKLIKIFKKNKSTIIKSTISVVAIIIVILVLIASINAIRTNSLDNIDYPLVYQKENGEIILLKSKNKEGKDGSVLSTSDGTGYTTYANKSNRYVLTKKENDLYIFDTKKKGESTKIADDTSIYGFSKEDSYIYLVDKDFDLYSYNYKESKMLLDAGITSVKDYSDKSIIYEKDEKLYFISFNPDKEDKTELVNDFEIAEFSKNGKSVLYTNSNDVLYRYDIKKKKHTKIAEDVETFYCENDACDKLYFTATQPQYGIYYYDKKVKTIAESISQIEYINAEDNVVVYSILSNTDITLYYKKGTKKAVEITSDYTVNNSLKIVDDDIYYTNEKRDLMHAKIRDEKLGKFTKIDEDVESALKNCKDGVYYSKNRNEQAEATFYIAKNGKKEKIGDDIRENQIVVSNNGEKIYYIKDFDAKDYGKLYVFDGKKDKIIAEKVYRFLYIRDNLVYFLKEYDVTARAGNLYKFNGSKIEKVDEKVSELSSTPNAYIVK